MRSIQYLTAAVVAALALAAGPAQANMCQAGRLSCATAMPAGGYCECTSRGATESGTVVERATPRKSSTNATAGGCGAQPNAPGCR